MYLDSIGHNIGLLHKIKIFPVYGKMFFLIESFLSSRGMFFLIESFLSSRGLSVVSKRKSSKSAINYGIRQNTILVHLFCTFIVSLIMFCVRLLADL